MRKLLAEALYWKWKWNESNPEVGMGPSMSRLLDEILEATDIDLPDVDRAEILLKVSYKIKDCRYEW